MGDADVPQKGLTPSERQWLSIIEAEWKATTSGLWYAHLTDDAYAMTAAYVSTEPGETKHGLIVDRGTQLAAGLPVQVDHEHVVAITLLQEPRLVDPDEAEDNARFIANAHQRIPQLLALIRRLDDALAGS